MDDQKLEALRARYTGRNEAVIHDPHFAAVAGRMINQIGRAHV